KRVDALAPLWSRFPADVPLYVVPPAVLDVVAGFPLHRGVLAIGRRAPDPGADVLLREAGDGDVLLLCGIANHDNMGGIFRNAAAFGVRAVLLDADCCDPLYRKAIRVSVGAALTVPFARLGRDEDALAILDRHGIVPVALSPAGALPLHAWQPRRRNAVLLGAEGPGLAPTLLARTETVRIDMVAGFDSLNVATTSGIVLHHLASRR
ncbi:MAG: RNA methyltransferase, partial [Sphingomonas sp.]